MINFRCKKQINHKCFPNLFIILEIRTIHPHAASKCQLSGNIAPACNVPTCSALLRSSPRLGEWASRLTLASPQLSDYSSSLIVVLFLHHLIHSPLAADDVGVQDEPMLESAATERTHFARHDATLEPLVPAQRRRRLISFPAPVARVFGVARVLPSDIPGLVAAVTLAPRQFAIVRLRQQHRRQQIWNEKTAWLDARP